MTLFGAHRFQLSLLLLALVLATRGWAQHTALSPAVGVEKLTFSAFGETSRAVPLRKSAVWVGRIAEELPDGLLCLDADWAPGAFGMIEGEPRYLLEIRSGSLRGLTLPNIANGQLSGLVPDLLTASLSALEREDELLWFEPDQPGFDRPVDRRWFYLDASGWAEAGGLESPTLTLQPGELLWIQRRQPLAEQLWRQF